MTDYVEIDPKIGKLVEENDGYCPCSVVHDADTKCPCKDFRRQESGTCYCGRFRKKEEKEK